MSMNKEIVLKVEDLKVEFKTEDSIVNAVKNISFEIRKGETVGIVGESGSGKSVTSLSVMGLIPKPHGKISNGSIQFKGQDLTKVSDDDIRKIRGNDISMIFQEPMTSLNPVYRCGNQVVEAIRIHQKMSKQEAIALTIELFEKVQLPDPQRIFKAYPHEISGGQKQRVMIAMAMSCNPEILIADEPTTALDVTVQKTILDLMQQLKDERDMAIMFITHDLGVIAEIADRVIVMYHGNIVEEGTVQEIFQKPQHPYTKGLLACRPPLDKRLRSLPIVDDFVSKNEEGEFQDTIRPFEHIASVERAHKAREISKEQHSKRLEALYKKEPVLQVKGLKTFFPTKKNLFGKVLENVKAVNDVSFDVYPGETLGLVGESGCGKTTLGRTILRLIEPTGGDILYKGRNLAHLSTSEMREMRKEIQIIFQDPYSSLNPRLTIGSAIMEPMQVHGVLANDAERKAKVEELLKKVNLKPEHFNRYPHEFSGGQRQRICIARALALNPKFIICDESVSALDVSVQAQVLNLLNKLKEDFGFTYIFISHDLSVVKFMSDRMVVMNKGEIEEMGIADSIYYEPKTAYTKKLIEAIPRGDQFDK
jgi:peptide/nickel transport system ATP-binding protein